jgi:hypothetical protein
MGGGAESTQLGRGKGSRWSSVVRIRGLILLVDEWDPNMQDSRGPELKAPKIRDCWHLISGDLGEILFIIYNHKIKTRLLHLFSKFNIFWWLCNFVQEVK